MSVLTQQRGSTSDLRSIADDWKKVEQGMTKISQDWNKVLQAGRSIADDWKKVEQGMTKISQDWQAVMRGCLVAQDKFLAEMAKALDEPSR